MHEAALGIAQCIPQTVDWHGLADPFVAALWADSAGLNRLPWADDT
jgi:hypothetical protein